VNEPLITARFGIVGFVESLPVTSSRTGKAPMTFAQDYGHEQALTCRAYETRLSRFLTHYSDFELVALCSD
jgi:hypothetical protein